MSVKITTLIENNKDEKSSLLNEHGLSLFIETDKMKIIFDAGQSDNFIKNAHNLNIDLKKADYVILSHKDEERLKKTIEYFKEKDIKIIGVSHCTGEIAINKLEDELKDRFIHNNTGNIIEVI